MEKKTTKKSKGQLYVELQLARFVIFVWDCFVNFFLGGAILWMFWTYVLLGTFQLPLNTMTYWQAGLSVLLFDLMVRVFRRIIN